MDMMNGPLMPPVPAQIPSMDELNRWVIEMGKPRCCRNLGFAGIMPEAIDEPSQEEVLEDMMEYLENHPEGVFMEEIDSEELDELDRLELEAESQNAAQIGSPKPDTANPDTAQQTDSQSGTGASQVVVIQTDEQTESCGAPGVLQGNSDSDKQQGGNQSQPESVGPSTPHAEQAETSSSAPDAQRLPKGNSKYWKEGEKVIDFSDNPYVESVTSKGIQYTRSFYAKMYELMEKKGMTAIAAYTALGFDVEILGKDRANSAGRHAKEMAASSFGFTVNPANYDGSIPSSKMDFSNMTMEEIYAYMQARIHYTEALLDVIKKNKSSSEERTSSLKRKS